MFDGFIAGKILVKMINQSLNSHPWNRNEAAKRRVFTILSIVQMCGCEDSQSFYAHATEW